MMGRAIAMNLRPDNPCDRLGPVLGKENEVVRHMRALPHRDVAAAIATVRASNAAEAVKLAFEFLVLTAARWGEVRCARWDRDGPRGPRVDHSGRADEGEPRAPGPAVPPRDGGSWRGADAW